MYFDDAEGPVFRPPSEAHSFILRVTIGCSHNRCTYCNMYRTVKFRVRTMAEIMAQVERAKRYKAHIRRVFLADGNALVLSTDKLFAIMELLKASLPKLQRISCYAGPKDILAKSPEDLIKLRENGLKLVYYGMESGDDEVLEHVYKGVTGQQSIHAGQRIVDAGIRLSMMVIIGLGGKLRSARHAHYTALAVNAIRPHMLSALTLMMYRGSELLAEYERGEFELLPPDGLMDEFFRLVQGIDLPPDSHCLFRSNHISNYVPFAATLPQDKARLLSEISEAKAALVNMTDWDPYNNVER